MGKAQLIAYNEIMKSPSRSSEVPASDLPLLSAAAAVAHDLAGSPDYINELWQTATAQNLDEAAAILTVANKLGQGNPEVRQAIVNGYLAQVALHQRQALGQSLEKLLINSDERDAAVPPPAAEPTAV